MWCKAAQHTTVPITAYLFSLHRTGLQLWLFCSHREMTSSLIFNVSARKPCLQQKGTACTTVWRRTIGNMTWQLSLEKLISYGRRPRNYGYFPLCGVFLRCRTVPSSMICSEFMRGWWSKGSDLILWISRRHCLPPDQVSDRDLEGVVIERFAVNVFLHIRWQSSRRGGGRKVQISSSG